MTLVFLPHNAVCDCSWTESYWWVINDETAPSHNSVFLSKNRQALRTWNGVYEPVIAANFNPLSPYATIRNTTVQRTNTPYACNASFLLVSESRYGYHKDAVLKEELHINTHSWFLLSWEEMLRPLEKCGELMYDGPVQSLRLCVLMPERIGVFLPLFGICSFDNVKHWCSLS